MALDFDTLRAANRERLLSTPKFAACKEWTAADWTMAITGELGEAANLLKKIARGDFEIGEEHPRGGCTVRDEVGDELADVVTYLDLLAEHLGIDLGEAVRSKFNVVSQRVGSAVRL